MLVGECVFLGDLAFSFLSEGQENFPALGQVMFNFFLTEPRGILWGLCSKQVPPESFFVLCLRQAVSVAGASCQSEPRSCGCCFTWEHQVAAVAGLLLPPTWSQATWPQAPGEGLGQQLLVQPGQFLVCFSSCPSSPAHLLSFSTALAPWSSTDHLESENTFVHSVGVLGPWEFCLHDSEEGKHVYLETLLF